MGVLIDRGVAEQVAESGPTSPRDVFNRLKHIQNYARIKASAQRITLKLAVDALKMLPRSQPSRDNNRPKSPPAHSDTRLPSDPLKRRYQVFVSSTYEDLKEERRYALQALLETKCIPTGMELFPAASEEQWELIKRVIDDCDYYLVVIAGRYGSLSPEGKSYTEKEYDYAISTGKSVIGFYHSEPDTLSGARLERNDDRRMKLSQFLEKVKRRMCKTWNTPDGLASAIKSAILHAIENDRKPGWIRASDLPSLAAIASLKETVAHARQGDHGPSSRYVSKAPIDVPITVHSWKGDLVPTFSRRELPTTHNRSLKLFPDDLFLILGPRLRVKRPRRTLKMFLEKKLAERAHASILQTLNKDVKRFSWNLQVDTFESILDIFLAERLVKIVRPPPGISTNASYWEISSKGQQRLAELRVAGSKAP